MVLLIGDLGPGEVGEDRVTVFEESDCTEEERRVDPLTCMWTRVGGRGVTVSDDETPIVHKDLTRKFPGRTSGCRTGVLGVL